MADILVGVSEVKITPPVGTPLLGPVLPSTGVHDDLFARALVLSDGRQRVAIICLDLIGMDFTFADELRAEVQRQTGITVTLLNCSHTHSAPFTIPWSVLGWSWFQEEGQEWRRELIAKIGSVVYEAATHLCRAVLRVGRTSVQVGLNRRMPTEHGVVMQPNPQGVVVPWSELR